MPPITTQIAQNKEIDKLHDNNSIRIQGGNKIYDNRQCEVYEKKDKKKIKITNAQESKYANTK